MKRDRIQFSVAPGWRDMIEKVARARGQSEAEFIRQAIKSQMPSAWRRKLDDVHRGRPKASKQS